MYCDQLTTRGQGDRCSRKATIIGENRDGSTEAYCTQHANYLGVRRRKWWYVEGETTVKTTDAATGEGRR